MTRCIIMAAGSQSRWRDGDGKLYEGTPKHLCAPEGEPLLARLCRQLEERGLTDVILTGPQEYANHVPDHVRVITPIVLEDTPEWLGATKVANTTGYWSTEERTIIWFGDSWLEDAVVDRVVNANNKRLWLHWCRMHPSPVTGCPYGEPFAVSFWPEHRMEYLEAIRIAAAAHKAGDTKRSGAWEIARVMGGARGRKIRRHISYPCFREVGSLGDGFSEDFDRPRDLVDWRANRAKWREQQRAQV